MWVLLRALSLDAPGTQPCLGSLPRGEEEQPPAPLWVLLGCHSCLRHLTSKVRGCNASFLDLEDH